MKLYLTTFIYWRIYQKKFYPKIAMFYGYLLKMDGNLITHMKRNNHSVSWNLLSSILGHKILYKIYIKLQYMSLIHASETVICLIWRYTDITYTIKISTSGGSLQGKNLYHNLHDIFNFWTALQKLICNVATTILWTQRLRAQFHIFQPTTLFYISISKSDTLG